MKISALNKVTKIITILMEALIHNLDSKIIYVINAGLQTCYAFSGSLALSGS